MEIDNAGSTFHYKMKPSKKKGDFKGQTQLIANQYFVSYGCGAFSTVVRALQSKFIIKSCPAWHFIYSQCFFTSLTLQKLEPQPMTHECFLSGRKIKMFNLLKNMI